MLLTIKSQGLLRFQGLLRLYGSSMSPTLSPSADSHIQGYCLKDRRCGVCLLGLRLCPLTGPGLGQLHSTADLAVVNLNF